METPVNMAKLYEYMKAVLPEFGLKFHQMDQVTVTFHENFVHFQCGKAWIAASAHYINNR